jgi:hypothetical protein
MLFEARHSVVANRVALIYCVQSTLPKCLSPTSV